MNHHQLKALTAIVERIHVNTHNVDLFILANQVPQAMALFEMVSRDLLQASKLAGEIHWNAELPLDSTSIE